MKRTSPLLPSGENQEVFHAFNSFTCIGRSIILCINTDCHYRSFESPGLPYRVLADASSHLIAAIQNSLKSGVNRNNRLDIEFRTDVFRVLFNGKGRNPPKGRGLFYDKNDFDTTYFKDDWYVGYDKLGDGCSIDFPVRLESKIRWSPKVFNADGILKSRIFSEIICVTLVKVRI